MGSRSVERGIDALKSLGPEVDGKIEVVQCDIDDQASVDAAAAHVKAKINEPLYALVNNAGVAIWGENNDLRVL
jgi:NAD(P)-dependent dehydrogenase (short-subunit alcohol dehydrogenase family)